MSYIKGSGQHPANLPKTKASGQGHSYGNYQEFSRHNNYFSKHQYKALVAMENFGDKSSFIIRTCSTKKIKLDSSDHLLSKAEK